MREKFNEKVYFIKVTTLDCFTLKKTWYSKVTKNCKLIFNSCDTRLNVSVAFLISCSKVHSVGYSTNIVQG